MYASLIGAGISQIYDLFRGQQRSSAVPAVKYPGYSGSNPNAPKVAGGSAPSLGSDVSKFLVSLQSGKTDEPNSAGTSAEAEAQKTGSVRRDLQSVAGNLEKLTAANGDIGQGDLSEGVSSQKAAGSKGASQSPVFFPAIASSLSAYARTRDLTHAVPASATLTV